MKIKLYSLIFSGILLCSTAYARRPIDADGDFQIWPHQVIEIHFKKKHEFRFDAEERWGGGASTLFHLYFQPTVHVRVTDWFEVAPGYRQTYRLRIAERKWAPIYEPMLILYFKKTYRKWEFALRNQIQYQIFDIEDPHWLYRWRFQIYFPFKLGKKVTPFLEDEIFFIERQGFTQNRFAVGFRFPMTKKFSSDVLYMYRTLIITSDDIRNQSVIRWFFRWNF